MSAVNGLSLTPDASQEKQIFDAAAKVDVETFNQQSSHNIKASPSNTPSSAVAPSTSVVRQSVAPTSASASNRFQKGRFQVLTVEESLVPPLKDASDKAGSTVLNATSVDVIAADIAVHKSTVGKEAVVTTATSVSISQISLCEDFDLSK